MGNLLYLLVIGTIASIHFQVSCGLEWTSSSLPDGSRVEACVGETVSFQWQYTSDDETVVNIEWYKSTQDGKTILATYVAGHMFKFPSVAMTVRFLPNAGVEIGNFTWEDFTVYHVTVNYRRGDTYISASRRSVTLVLPDAPILAANRLVAYMQPEPVTDVTTGQRHVQLSCGQFLNLGGKQISVTWRTPSGAKVPSTSNTNGTFHLTLPNPVVGGSYKCQLKDPSLVARCVRNMSGLKRGAHVHVDKVDALLTLLKSRDVRLRSDVSRLQERVELQEDTCTRVATDISSLREDISTVDTRQGSVITSLKEDVKDQGSAITSLREATTSVREDIKNQGYDITSLREDLKNQGDDTTSLREDLKNQGSDITSLREDVKKQGSDITSLREDTTSVREDLKNQGDDITSLREDVKNQGSDISSLREDLKILGDNITSVKEDLKNQGSDVTTLRGDITSVREDVKNQASDITSLRGDITSVREDVKNQGSDITSLRGDITSVREDVKNQGSDITSLREDLKNQGADFTSLAENTASKQTQEMDKLRSALDAHGTLVNTELKQTVSNLQSAFQTLVDDAKLELKSLIEEVKSTYTSDVDNLHQQVSDIRDSVLSVTNDLENTPASCVDVREYDTSNSVHTLTVNNKNINVFCDQQTARGGWTVIQRRRDGSVDFYRGWTDYVKGFGNRNGEFWLGLDNIHLLTTARNQTLRVDLQDFDNNRAYAEYRFFAIDGRDSFYRLHVDGYTGTAGDSLTYHNNRSFSTHDSDHDSDSRNCAVYRRGAWWYTACHHSNLNGPYLTSAQLTSKSITWYHWKKADIALKHVEMKIRPAV